MIEAKPRMGKPASTRQVNLMLTPAQEELVRHMVMGIG
jgi:hypothetical protein